MEEEYNNDKDRGIKRKSDTGKGRGVESTNEKKQMTFSKTGRKEWLFDDDEDDDERINTKN